MDDFDHSNVSSHSGFDDISYPGDPRRFMEVIKTSCVSSLFVSDGLNIFKFYSHLLLCLTLYLTNYS